MNCEQVSRRATVVFLNAVLAVLLLSSCLHQPTAPTEPFDDTSAFVVLWQQYETSYPLFAHKNINWMDVCREFYPQAQVASGEDELLQIMSDMLAVLEDPALFIFSTEGDTLFPYIRQYDSNVDMDVLIGNYLEPHGYCGNVQGFGWCDPMVFPYAYFNSFPTYSGSDSLELSAYDAFIEICTVNEIPSIIIDIRMNPPGAKGDWSNFCQLTMSRLVTRAKVSAVYRLRVGPEYDQYQDFHPWIQPAGQYRYDGHIYLLTGGGCTQAAEDMAVNLSYFDNVTLIGDTTAGSITQTGLTGLPGCSSWWARVGTGTVLSHDYKWIEGSGMAPDVFVDATEADFAAGIDPVLEYTMDEMGY